MEIHPAAWKHGVSESAIRHAIAHALYSADLVGEGPPWRVLYLGPDEAGNLLEVVVLERDNDQPLAIHAMKMQTRYRELLPQEDSDGPP